MNAVASGAGKHTVRLSDFGGVARLAREFGRLRLKIRLVAVAVSTAYANIVMLARLIVFNHIGI
jgi:hypothetical protein